MADDTSALTIDDVTVAFGSLLALKNVSLTVPAGRTIGVIGPNGAGKSTLIDVIAGVRTPTTGSVRYFGDDITAYSTPTRARGGLRRTFQHLELFDEMSVLENVMVAADTADTGFGSARRRRADVWELLDSVGIRDIAHAKVGTLPHPVKRLVSYARAVAGRPRCILLDEPVAGLAESERDAFVERLRRDMQRRDLTVVLVEHDMRFVQGLCDEVYVLNAGGVIAHGAFAEVAASDAVRTAYLGGSDV
jgi:ABC-type branched-subunit amino acid transport system ATPase component